MDIIGQVHLICQILQMPVIIVLGLIFVTYMRENVIMEEQLEPFAHKGELTNNMYPNMVLDYGCIPFFMKVHINQ
jgi:hypothetical protein